ncbi:MAG: phytoene/squalene synthase family protein [Aestuariivirga sp.]
MNDHCLDLVRDADKDRYLASLFAPSNLQPHLHALYAFNIEIARIRDAVTEPQLGEIRQQWWIDTLDAIYGREAPPHPVAQALARAIEKGDLPKHALRGIILARQFDLYSDPMPSLHDLEGYLGETESAIMQLASLILAGNDALGSAEASGLTGVALGLTRMLRQLPLHRSRGQCYIPRDMLAAREIEPQNVLDGTKEASLAVVLAEIRQHAVKRLEDARGKLWLVPRPALPALLPAATVPLYLERMKKMGLRILNEEAQVLQVRRQWRIFTSAWSESL